MLPSANKVEINTTGDRTLFTTTNLNFSNANSVIVYAIGFRAAAATSLDLTNVNYIHIVCRDADISSTCRQMS